MRGKALQGSVVGIFGLGRIGLSVARKLEAFEPKEIIYHNRREIPEICELNFLQNTLKILNQI